MNFRKTFYTEMLLWMNITYYWNEALVIIRFFVFVDISTEELCFYPEIERNRRNFGIVISLNSFFSI